jgi:hypothetical protein
VGWMLQLVPLHRSATMKGSVVVNMSPAAVHAEADVHATLLRNPPCAWGGVGIGKICQSVPFQCSARGPASSPWFLSGAPTAMQSVLDVQATLFNSAPEAPAGFGVAEMLQSVPFQRSASVPIGVPERSVALPTAMQADIDGHATLPRMLPLAPTGLGVGRMLQRVPSQRSASVALGFPELSVAPPTAMQAEIDGHATLPRMLPLAPGGLGVGRMLHRVPSQRSASVAPGVPELFVAKPTAMHDDADGHATAVSKLPRAPVGLSVGWMLQRVPSHRSAIVPSALPVRSARLPTAVQAELDAQASPFSWLLCAPRRVGVGCTFQRPRLKRSARLSAPEFPTAVQIDADVQATATRPRGRAPDGVASIRHRLPSHRSASVASVFPDWSVELPTAVHAVADVQATSLSSLPGAPAGLGVRWIVHRLPFHRSASVRPVPERVR